MTNLNYTVMTFEPRTPVGMSALPRGKWFYYEIGINNTVTLTGYRAGTREDVEQVVRSIIERLNRDNPAATAPASVASRLIFPPAPSHPREDEEGNVIDDDDSDETEGEITPIITEDGEDATDRPEVQKESSDEPDEDEGE